MAETLVEDTAPERPTERARLGYQPGLDGLRAVAIVAVMVFHAAFHQAALFNWGSWLGVDLFFVLSGFLITTLLLREFGAHDRISLRNFYVRRVLRLYPLIVVCVLLASVTIIVPIAGFQKPTWLGVASIAGYFTNWIQVADSGPRQVGSFAHLWSLSIEEQFYVVWPLLVVVTLRLRGRRWSLTALSALLTAVVVAVRYKVWLDARQFRLAHYYEFDLVGQRASRAWSTVYYGSFTHSDGLLVGCVLAALLGLNPRTPRRVVRVAIGVLAICAVVVSVVIARRVAGVYAPTFMTTWGQITFNVGAAVIIAHVLFSPTAPLPRLLAARPLVWIGRRSYGMYVFHIFVIEVMSSAGYDSIPWLLVALGLTMVVAGVSYRYYEAPILRLKARFNAVS